MTITRCPACLKAFRVSAEQLRLRAGRVRCGHCYRPFDALAHRITETATGSENAPDLAPVFPSFRPEDARPAAAPAPPTPDQLLEFGVPDLPPPSSTPPRPTPADEELVATQPEAVEIPEEIARTKTTLWKHADPAPSGRIGNQAPPPTTRARRAEDDRVEPSLEGSDALTPPPLTASVAAMEAAVDDDDLEQWRSGLYRRDEPPIRHRWLWALGIGILLGTLSVQAAYLYREPITREWPQLRPLYLEACTRLGCDVPLPRISSSIVIEASALEPVQRRSGAFVLEARIQNQAAYPQQFPHLELTLTGKDDQPVARRALAPDEWLPKNVETDTGFAAGDSIDVSLPLLTTEIRGASGYRLSLFYP